ncbi:protein phosphatase [Aliiroseovarius marinus]|uniref:phosphatase domain-containing putative toxin n=1 Tax=Aliiroseovarius marinus TaxID=2500159 RepID=UPI003D7E4BF1
MEPLFPIASLPAGPGTLGICPLPGHSGDFREDLETLLDWAPDMVLSMTTMREMHSYGAATLGTELSAKGVIWHHLPIQDFGAPSERIEHAWPKVSQSARSILNSGGKVLAHCKGGCGRSGMILLRLLVEEREAPEAALDRLRMARPCAVETAQQQAWACQPANGSAPAPS